MERKICRECSTEDSAKNRLLYAGHGQWVCRNERNCEHRAERHKAEIERVIDALAGNDTAPCGHTHNEHDAMRIEIVQSIDEEIRKIWYGQ